jgi:hypothetical protein
MRIISTIIIALLATSLTGCISYSRHETDRVVEHRSGSYRGERSHSYGGYYRDHDHHDRGHDYRHHPRGR